MKVESDKTMSPAETLAAAEAWYERQMVLLKQCHGVFWPEHQAWLDGFVREQLRQRLIAKGWRPKL